jgi:transcriptional antiterminator NusG
MNEEKNVGLKWYIVHTYSGFENKVKLNLEERVKALKQENYFGKVLVPTEQVVELKKGQKKTSSRKFYPGYIMVQMALNKETWHTVRNTARLQGFLAAEVNRIQSRTARLKESSSRWKKVLPNQSRDILLRKAMK